MKNRTKIAAILSFFLIFASIFNVSATMGVAAGDKFKYDIELHLDDGTTYNYTVTGDLELEVNSIEGAKINCTAFGTNGKIEGTYPDDYNLTDGSTNYIIEIFEDDLLTNASLMTGAYFIDSDFTPKTFSHSINVTGVELYVDSEYDDNGVLKNFEMTSVFGSSVTMMKMTRSGFAIPGYSVLIVGVISLLAIPMIVRKIRR